MPVILPFGQAHDTQAWRVGAKAARLSQLHASDFPVPDGFAVTADALELFLAANDLLTTVAETQEAFDSAPPKPFPPGPRLCDGPFSAATFPPP